MDEAQGVMQETAEDAATALDVWTGRKGTRTPRWSLAARPHAPADPGAQGKHQGLDLSVSKGATFINV